MLLSALFVQGEFSCTRHAPSLLFVLNQNRYSRAGIKSTRYLPGTRYRLILSNTASFSVIYCKKRKICQKLCLDCPESRERMYSLHKAESTHILVGSFYRETIRYCHDHTRHGAEEERVHCSAEEKEKNGDIVIASRHTGVYVQKSALDVPTMI